MEDKNFNRLIRDALDTIMGALNQSELIAFTSICSAKNLPIWDVVINTVKSARVYNDDFHGYMIDHKNRCVVGLTIGIFKYFELHPCKSHSNIQLCDKFFFSDSFRNTEIKNYAFLDPDIHPALRNCDN